MTDMTLEELAVTELQADLLPGEYVPALTVKVATLGRLVAMARELIRIRSAAEFLQVSDRRVCLVVDYRAPGEATYQIRAWAIPNVAAMLGWSDPTTPKAGATGEGGEK